MSPSTRGCSARPECARSPPPLCRGASRHVARSPARAAIWASRRSWYTTARRSCIAWVIVSACRTLARALVQPFELHQYDAGIGEHARQPPAEAGFAQQGHSSREGARVPASGPLRGARPTPASRVPALALGAPPRVDGPRGSPRRGSATRSVSPRRMAVFEKRCSRIATARSSPRSRAMASARSQLASDSSSRPSPFAMPPWTRSARTTSVGSRRRRSSRNAVTHSSPSAGRLVAQ